MKPVSIIVDRKTKERKEQEAKEQEQFNQRLRDIEAGRRDFWDGRILPIIKDD
jgi:hypothetical protein